MNARTFFLLVSPLLLAGVLLGVTMRRSLRGDLYWDDDVRSEVQELVDQRYVEPLAPEDEQALFDAAMRAYVGTLDPFSRYFTPEERRELEEDTSGSFAGVGVQVRAVTAGLLVSAVYRDGPAHRAGLRPGDIVTAVDGTSVAGMALDATIALVKGPEGTVVTLEVTSEGDPPRAVAVTRGMVDLDTVPSVRLLPGEPPVAYVRVAQFSETTPQDVRAALERLAGKGAGAVVLDLRQNLGGVVSAAVELAGLFLPSESVVCLTRERHRRREYTVEGEPGAAAPFGQPLVVLVDGGSASASEILAGALQDHGRAVLVGERTYGKFLVQTLLPLHESEALVRITTARYETPRGRSGQRHPDGVRGGIMPDVRVDLSGDDRRAVFEAFVQQAGPRWLLMEGRDTEADASDTQLRAALELLRGAPAPAEPLRPAAPEPG